MRAEHKSKTVTFVIAGLILQFLGGILAKAGLLGWLLGAPIAVVGSLLLLMGCCFYAKAKGFPWWFGLLGLLSFLGLLVLYLLPDRHK